ncbi:MULTISPECIES: HEXXH motif domain-containing protein [unclassified Parafrankia]|uniref:aKG-HExxH-type peptide beta-hydroxylase n=1 Tax=unclassified Parafrankia TaxID=2994368 RepID=UPI00135A43F0|nr:MULTISPECIES: HEXXH motif domain-containing protein [unclassified Parafrankia]
MLRLLWASEHSQRLVLLRALLDEARGRPAARGPLATADHAWDLLVRAEHSDAEQVAAVLDYPTTGLWAALTLRRLRGLRHDDAPLWVDVGYFHAIAAAAAMRAGISFRAVLPVRRGNVALPTLGHTRVPCGDPWEAAELVVDEGPARLRGPWGVVTIRRDGGPHGAWSPLSVLSAEHGGRRLRVTVEDADPYRHVVHTALPVPLRGRELERWRELIDGAWRVLVREHPDQATEVAELLQAVVPTARARRFLPRSASSGDGFGGALLSMPDSKLQLAATLVHEMQHAKLGALLHLVDLYTPGNGERFYAPWRDDPRPLAALLQGIFAFFGVTRFWRRQRTVVAGGAATAAHFEFALWRAGVWRAIEDVRAAPDLTPLGHRCLLNISVVLAGWLAEPVPGTAARWASAVSADHRSGWRLHHLRPDAGAVAMLTEAWSAGQPPPAAALHVPPRMSADPSVAALEAREALVRMLLYDRRQTGEWPPAMELGRQVRGAIPADVSWLEGDAHAAAIGFDRALDTSPGDPHAWSGLGLAARDAGDVSAARALAVRPELVRAVHRALSDAGRAPGRRELAGWVGAGLGA